MKTSVYQLPALLLLLLLGKGGITKAQSPSLNSPYSQVSIASPTAASLGKYADIPVNTHTGIPEISIPLYTIKEGPLTLPISLSYHGGGVPVMEPASWVGTSWALNAGGVITRTVMGTQDESGAGRVQYGHFSDYGYSSYFGIAGSSLQGPTHADDIAGGAYYQFTNGIYDGEPDLYTFNFNGYVGKFYFSDDRTPVLINGEDLKIEYYYPRDNAAAVTSMSVNIQGFIITVPTGDKYYFGITDNAAQIGAPPIETTFPFSVDHEVATETVFSSYYLNKIVAADGVHTIQLTYASERYSYYTISMFPIPSTPPDGTPAGTNSKEYRLVSNNIDGVRLAQIRFSNGSVDFNPSAAARTDLAAYINGNGSDEVANTQANALDNIKITSSDFCKQFSFSYSYFGGDNTAIAGSMNTTHTDGSTIQTDKTRLKLESVLEKSCDGSISANPWVFSYFSNFLPRRLSFAQDHWGFYNEKNGNSSLGTLIPAYSLSGAAGTAIQEFSGADREAVWPAMANGTLTKITYPTGGSSTFEFEPNDIWALPYNLFETRFVSGTAIGFGTGTNQPQTLHIPFSSNPYLFTLDFHPGTPDGTSPSATLSGPFVNLYGTTDPNTLHTETLVQPGAGTRDYTLSLNNINVNGSSVSAEARVYERVPKWLENRLAGGIRILKNTTMAGAGAPDIVTTYGYRANGQSTGTLYSRPRYVSIIRNGVVAQYGFFGSTSSFPNIFSNGCMNPNSSASFTYLKSPCGILPMSTTQGHHMGYDQVSVAQTGNGRTDYYYYGSSYWKSTEAVSYRNLVRDVCDTSIPFQPAIPPPFDFSRGKLKEEMVFTKDGQHIKNRQYTFVYDSSSIVTPVFLSKSISGLGLNTRFERKAYWEKQAQVIEKTIFPGGNVQTTKVFKYDSPYHRQVTQSTETASTGDVLLTKNKYALDFRVAASDNIDDGLSTYKTACAACEATRQYELTNCPAAGCFGGYLHYDICRANARKAYIDYRRTNFTNSTNAFQTAHNTAKNQADGTLQPLLQLQDNYANPLVETSAWKNGKLLNASYTAFGADLALTDKVFPASQWSLLLASPAATFAPAAVSGNSVGLDSRYAATPEKTLSFANGNLIQLASRTGPVTSYLWGYGNNLPIAEVKGAPASQIAFTSFENNSPGGWNFDAAQCVSTAHTGVRAYGLGGGAGATLNRVGLPAGEYELVLWAHGTGVPQVDATGSTVPRHVAGAVVGLWHQHHYYVSLPAASVVQISTPGYIWIDDVRLHPVGAQASTYTHAPLVGLSSNSDANGQPTYYEYDALMRLRLVRDPATNIRQKLEYNYRP